jgi:hypothetical protein
MKLALKALDTLVSPVGSIYAQARKALRTALAAPRPEIQVMVDPAALTAAAAYAPVRIVTPDDAEIAQAAKFEKAYQNNRTALAAPSEDIEALRRDAERLRGLLREAREYLPEHHPIAESLFPRIDQALQEVPIDLNAEWGLAVDAPKEPATEPAIARGEVPR